MEIKLSNKKYTNFQTCSKVDGYNFITKNIYNWKNICLSHHMDLHIKLNLHVSIAKCQMPMIEKPL
jgi:hypothetical protein